MSRVFKARPGPKPLVRKIVNSELLANRAITKTVPINTVMGSNSYKWAGISKATNTSACGKR